MVKKLATESSVIYPREGFYASYKKKLKKMDLFYKILPSKEQLVLIYFGYIRNIKVAFHFGTFEKTLVFTKNLQFDAAKISCYFQLKIYIKHLLSQYKQLRK